MEPAGRPAGPGGTKRPTACTDWVGIGGESVRENSACGTLQNVTHYKNIHIGALQCPALLLPLAGPKPPPYLRHLCARRFCCRGETQATRTQRVRKPLKLNIGGRRPVRPPHRRHERSDMSRDQTTKPQTLLLKPLYLRRRRIAGL